MNLKINNTECTKPVNFVTKGGKVRKRIIWLYLTTSPKDVLVTADFADLKAAYQAKAIAPYKNRGWFVPVGNVEDNGEAATYESVDGMKFLTSHGSVDEIYQLPEGTECQFKQLTEFCKQNPKLWVQEIDEDFTAWGIETETGVRGMRALQVHTVRPTRATKTTVTKYRLRVALADVNEWMGASHYPLGFDPANILQVETVKLVEITPGGAAAGVHVLGIVGACDGCDSYNLASVYATEFASASAFPTVTAANASVAITSVASYSEAGVVTGMQINYNAAGANYVDDTKIYVRLPEDLSIVHGLTEVYLESNILEMTCHE